MRPSVSVIIPTHNRADLLREAVDSVLLQTFQDFEVVVVDDGSTDHTREVMGSFPGQVRYFYQDNRRRSAARNRGLREASGRYVLFLDDDDLLLPGSLQLLAGFLEANPQVGVVFSDGIYCDPDGRHIRRLSQERPQVVAADAGVFLEQLAVSNVVGAIHAAMVRREWLERVDQPCFDESLEVGEDADLWLRLAALGCTFQYLDQCTCLYRLHSGNTGVLGFIGHTHYRQAYFRARLKVFHSDLFLRLSPSTQMKFLHCLLLDPVYGDRDLSEPVLSSDRFGQLPPRVQSQILYLTGIDDLRARVPAPIARGRLARAASLSPASLKYWLACSLASLYAPLLLAVVTTVRRLRDRTRGKPALPASAQLDAIRKAEGAMS